MAVCAIQATGRVSLADGEGDSHGEFERDIH
jgi:hypothetical protein